MLTTDGAETGRIGQTTPGTEIAPICLDMRFNNHNLNIAMSNRRLIFYRVKSGNFASLKKPFGKATYTHTRPVLHFSTRPWQCKKGIVQPQKLFNTRTFQYYRSRFAKLQFL